RGSNRKRATARAAGDAVDLVGLPGRTRKERCLPPASPLAFAGLRGLRSGLSSLRTRNIDSAAEVRAVFDHDSGSLHISHEVGAFAKDNTLVGFDISLHRAADNYLGGLDVGIGLAISANRQTVVRLQLALDLAFDAKLVFAEYIAFDTHGGPNQGAI